jgi:hypothetical protein
MKGPLVKKIAAEKSLSDDVRAQLVAALREFKEKYAADRASGAEKVAAG